MFRLLYRLRQFLPSPRHQARGPLQLRHGYKDAGNLIVLHRPRRLRLVVNNAKGVSHHGY